MRKYRNAVLAGCAIFAFPLAGHAYVDPGAGSMLLQLLLGGIAGVLLVGKLYWRRLKGVFGFKDRKTNPAPQTEHEPPRK